MDAQQHKANLIDFSLPTEAVAGAGESAQSCEETVSENVGAQQSGWAQLIESAARASGEVHAELARLETDWNKSLQRPLRRKLLGRMCSHITSIMAAAADARGMAATARGLRVLCGRVPLINTVTAAVRSAFS